jgi:outer membrane protein OmpA-like peptidoglycan-associated protein
MRPQDEPPVPQPLNSTLQTPTVGNLPGVEASRAAPPPSHPAAMPQPAPSALPQAAVQSGNPQPAPPTATLPPPQVSPQVAAMPPPKLPPVPVTVASLDISPGSSGLPGDAQSRLADVVAQYKAKPGIVRIVSYAAPGTGGAEQLNSFRSALDRAQTVAKELAGAGIPADKIQTQAAPSSDSAPAGRLEIQLLP